MTWNKDTATSYDCAFTAELFLINPSARVTSAAVGMCGE